MKTHHLQKKKQKNKVEARHALSVSGSSYFRINVRDFSTTQLSASYSDETSVGCQGKPHLFKSK